MVRQKGKGRKRKKRRDGEPEVESVAESDYSDSSSSMEETERSTKIFEWPTTHVIIRKKVVTLNTLYFWRVKMSIPLVHGI